MKRTLFNVGNGALVCTEEAGVVTLTADKSLQVGGGKAAGILSGNLDGSIVLQGKVAFDMGAAILIAHSPAALQPLEEGGLAIADSEIAAN